MNAPTSTMKTASATPPPILARRHETYGLTRVARRANGDGVAGDPPGVIDGILPLSEEGSNVPKLDT